jgi:hypothetical protein
LLVTREAGFKFLEGVEVWGFQGFRECGIQMYASGQKPLVKVPTETVRYSSSVLEDAMLANRQGVF